MKNTVVVKAIGDGHTMPKKDSEETDYRFQQGDLGLLRWDWHKEDARFLEPLVLWDKDPARQYRHVYFGSIEVVGLQCDQFRLCPTS